MISNNIHLIVVTIGCDYDLMLLFSVDFEQKLLINKIYDYLLF